MISGFMVCNRSLIRGHMKSIVDRSFRYTRSAETDLRKTFARLRRQQRNKIAVKTDLAGNVSFMLPTLIENKRR
jgi:hypothetical protein